jgi:ATP-binding protein involved in chromosome partitioning
MIFRNKQQKESTPGGVSEKPRAAHSSRAVPPSLAHVKHIVAVASGKGGVGKSTVSANLAVALKELGHSVGLMDADIYGPSQPGMLGAGRAKAGITQDRKLTPVNRYGIDFVSMGLLTDDDAPVIWRAPIATKMIMQFIGAVEWGELDYLLIDLPPGTGDVQLTLAQQAALTGAVIVTTPQDVALGVAKKGLRMFNQVNVPVLGIIENMSGFTCAHCGEVTPIFKEGGGKQMAEDLQVPYLSAIPLDTTIMSSGDEGVPVLAKSKDSPASKAFMAVAHNLIEEIDRTSAEVSANEPSQLELVDSGNLAVAWDDGLEAELNPYDLRIHCTCAECVDEDTGEKILDSSRVPLDIAITNIKPIGRYGVSLSFSDHHSTGIYTYERLRELAQRKQQSFDV